MSDLSDVDPTEEVNDTHLPGRRRRFGELLVAAGVVSEKDVAAALDAAHPRERLGAALLRLGFADEEQIADALAEQLALPRISIEDQRPRRDALARVPSRLAAKHGVLPLRVDGEVLTVAMDDPTDIVALDDLRLAGEIRSVRPVVATTSGLQRARRRAYRGDATQEVLGTVDSAEAGAGSSGPPSAGPGTYPGAEAVAATGSPRGVGRPDAGPLAVAADTLVARLVDAIFSDAVSARASDVHIEPNPDGATVRMRVDGLLRETMQIPPALVRQATSRLKVISGMDITERRLPQDGRAVIDVAGEGLDVRTSTMPTLYGETVVLRLLPRGRDKLHIDELGLDDEVHERFLDALTRPQGLVLVTGPTGSGKTTTLYAGIDAVTDPTRNVLTLEDPVELELAGVNQTQVDPRFGLTFATGLRHLFRQDPDVILVGEIRDQETAELAVEAASTGHLVLATLHTNDAPSSIARLIDLGADPFLVASTLNLVLAQRLAQRICTDCAVPDEPEPAVLERLGLTPTAMRSAPARRGAGCARCDDTGALGRVAIGECMQVSPRLRELITSRAPERLFADAARAEGLRQLRDAAVDRAMRGEITFDEALRVTPATGGGAHCPACRASVADDFVVCPFCAHELVGATCPGCSLEIRSEWSNCPWCRQIL